MASPKTILFLGATGGCGLSALRRSLDAGHTCIALCRTPSKLSAKLSSSPPNLHLEQGNAHDIDALARLLVSPTNPSSIVDAVVFSIGGAFDWSKMTIDDPNVCEKGINAVLEALRRCRAGGATGMPRIVAISSTGITESGKRDVPLLMAPLYHVLLKNPHKDRKAMERALVESQEEKRWTIIRASLMTDGPETTLVRVGVEDAVAKKVESEAVGYTVSREDVGKWIFENLIQKDEEKWDKKAVTVTY